MTTTFETAKVGDRVWCMRFGWGEVRETGESSGYPIYACFLSGDCVSFTTGGLYDEGDIVQSLFWDEIVIEAPVKPMPDLSVDAKVLVWVDGSSNKYCRHFSHFENDYIYVFDKGLSSWTGHTASAWDHWELAE